ncbi:MAG: hypothetical protein K2L12_01010 [Clostridia bacterium]|nr:hypothetical protein [Clostridia bacterium]
MKSWLKFFGLSFFSDKIAKEARIRGVLNCVLAFLLALIFIYCGVLAANTIPFYTHYNNSSDFKAFVSEVIGKENLTVKDKLVCADKVINTFAKEEDAAQYVNNGYNLVIDTRPSDALDDFEAYCVSKDGAQITYEYYLTLSDGEKSNYEFKINYTPNVLILTDEMISGFEGFLSSSEDTDIKKQYSALTSDKDKLTAEQYKNSLYALYVRAYYPDITSYERAGEVPLLRSYYYRNYLYSSELGRSLFIFDDVMFGYFQTDGGIEVTFYGYFTAMPDGSLDAEFITNAFASSVSVSATVYLMNIVRFIPLIAFIPLILALIAKLVLTFINDEKYKKYTTCLKMQFAYLTVGSLITALAIFVCGFFISSGVLNILPLIILAAVMLVRTAVLLIGEYINTRKTAAKIADTQTE